MPPPARDRRPPHTPRTGDRSRGGPSPTGPAKRPGGPAPAVHPPPAPQPCRARTRGGHGSPGQRDESTSVGYRTSESVRDYFAGLDFGSPGNVPALISLMLLTPSLSESSFSIERRIFSSTGLPTAAFCTSFPYGFRSVFDGGILEWHVRQLALPRADPSLGA